MEIEMRSFYPFERNDQKQLLKGSLHIVIKLGDVELNIRAVLARS